MGIFHFCESTLNGYEFEQVLGDGEGQGGLASCGPQGCRDGRDWATEQQQQPLISLNNLSSSHMKGSFFFFKNSTVILWNLSIQEDGSHCSCELL